MFLASFVEIGRRIGSRGRIGVVFIRVGSDGGGGGPSALVRKGEERGGRWGTGRAPACSPLGGLGGAAGLSSTRAGCSLALVSRVGFGLHIGPLVGGYGGGSRLSSGP